MNLKDSQGDFRPWQCFHGDIFIGAGSLRFQTVLAAFESNFLTPSGSKETVSERIALGSMSEESLP